MTYVLLFLISIISPLLAFAEPVAVLCGLSGELHWLATGMAIAGGQTTGFLILYVFGDAFLQRFQWLQRKMDRVNFEALGNNRLWIISLSGLFGFPPAIALSLAGPVFEKRLGLFLGSLFCARTIRFCVLVGVPTFFTSVFDPELIPDWVRNVFA